MEIVDSFVKDVIARITTEAIQILEISKVWQIVQPF